MPHPKSEPIVQSSEPLLFIAEIERRAANEYMLGIASMPVAAARAAGAEAQNVLSKAAKRLHNYAEAHRALQPPMAAGPIDLSAYLPEICSTLVRASLGERAFVSYSSSTISGSNRNAAGGSASSLASLSPTPPTTPFRAGREKSRFSSWATTASSGAGSRITVGHLQMPGKVAAAKSSEPLPPTWAAPSSGVSKVMVPRLCWHFRSTSMADNTQKRYRNKNS